MPQFFAILTRLFSKGSNVVIYNYILLKPLNYLVGRDTQNNMYYDVIDTDSGKVVFILASSDPSSHTLAKDQWGETRFRIHGAYADDEVRIHTFLYYYTHLSKF